MARWMLLWELGDEEGFCIVYMKGLSERLKGEMRQGCIMKEVV